MYLPKHFEQSDLAALHDSIEANPLGTLVTTVDGALDANHIPFELDRGVQPYGRLLCHVARANPLLLEQQNQPSDCLVIFNGPSAYVSPSYYPSKTESHKVVPTYNYAVVHVHGRITVHDDPRWVRGQVGRLTKRFESRRPAPWKMGDAPPSFIDEQLANIVGLEIEITRIVGKWKMSQNRTDADRDGVVRALSESSFEEEQAVAKIVEREGRRLKD